MHLFSVAIPFLFLGLVLGGGYGGSGYRQSSSYSDYDCGGTCGGGCSTGHCGGSGGSSGQYIETSGSGCDSGDCGGGGSSYGGGGSYRTSHSSSSHAGYHKSTRTVVKETRNDELKIIIGAPKQTVHRTASYVEAAPVIRKTTYIEQPAPVIIKKTYISQPVHKTVRYVDSYGDGGGCTGPCGGSKIVKVIKKTTYTDDGYGSGGSCSSCDYASSGDVEYAPVVTKKVTRIISQPKVVTTRVIKTRVVDQPAGEFYEDSGPSYGGGGYGRSGGGSKAFAFASAGAGGGSYGSGGGGGGGCRSGCDEWKKKK